MSTALPMELCSSILSSSAWVVRCLGVSASGTLSFDALECATDTGSWARGAGFRTTPDIDEIGPVEEILLELAARVWPRGLEAASELPVGAG